MTTLDKNTIAKLAEHLENAELGAHSVTKITNDFPNIDWEDCYDIQDEIRRRKESRGHRIAGKQRVERHCLACITSRLPAKHPGTATHVS